MNRISGIIFDLDGVIVSTDKYHYLAWKQLADREGIYFDEIINNRLRGVSRMQSLEIVLERADREYNSDEKTEMATFKNEAYKRLLNLLTPEDRLSGVTETLEYLKRKGIKIAIGSSSKNAPFILKQIGLDGYFDAVSDGNNITHSKPDPEVFLKAAEMLNLSPKNCMIVEDALAGIDAGLAGGFDTVAVGDAVSHPQAKYKLNVISELCDLV